MPIEQVAPECARLVDLQQEVEWLGSGFGADATALGLPWWPAEGPVWWQEAGIYCLVTSAQAYEVGARGGVSLQSPRMRRTA